MIIKFDTINPKIDDSAWVADNAVVAGNVRIDKDASVWFGAVVRGDTNSIVIGENSNVQDNATIHCSANSSTSIGRNVTVGHNAIVHGATIEDDVLIGMHATVLDNAVVGHHSLIAAGALVKANQIIPPFSLVVGVPGKVARELTVEQAEGNTQNALHYVHLKEGYRK